MDVVVMAAMVPIGMDFWASLRSPERLEPAMIPAGGHTDILNLANTPLCSAPTYPLRYLVTTTNFVMTTATLSTRYCVAALTCDGGEVDSDQQGEEAGDVGHDVAVGRGRWAVLLRHRRQPSLLQDHPFLQVVTKQVLWTDTQTR